MKFQTRYFENIKGWYVDDFTSKDIPAQLTFMETFPKIVFGGIKLCSIWQAYESFISFLR